MVSSLLILILLIGISTFFIAYLIKVFSKPVTLSNMLEKRLPSASSEVKLRENVALPTQARKFVTEGDEVLLSLSDIKEFSPSFPEIHVELGEASPPVGVGEEKESQQTEESSGVEQAGDAQAVESSTQTQEISPKAKGVETSAKNGVKASAPKSGERVKEEKETSSKETPSEKRVNEGISESKSKKAQQEANGEAKFTYLVFASVIRSDDEKGGGVEERVRQTRERLMELGFSATAIDRSQGEKKIFLIQVNGTFTDYEKAEAVKNKLKEAGFSETYILRKSPN